MQSRSSPAEEENREADRCIVVARLLHSCCMIVARFAGAIAAKDLSSASASSRVIGVLQLGCGESAAILLRLPSASQPTLPMATYSGSKESLVKTSSGCFLRVTRTVAFLFAAGQLLVASAAGSEAPQNLALNAQATASEMLGDLTPDKAIDGKPETRWSGIPGHNQGVWFQLEWKQPVTVGEVVVDQYDTFAMEWDLQIREDESSAWHTIRHFGKPGERLPKVVTCNFSPRKIIGLRIDSITNGPSFNEVQVFAKPFADGVATVVASDLRGHFLGIVCDPSAAPPVEGAHVTLSGKTKGGPWQTSAKSDAKGIFLCRHATGAWNDLVIGEAQHIRVGGNSSRRKRARDIGRADIDIEVPAAAFRGGADEVGGRGDVRSADGLRQLLQERIAGSALPYVAGVELEIAARRQHGADLGEFRRIGRQISAIERRPANIDYARRAMADDGDR